MFILPVSQTPVRLRAPDGRDELALAEGSTDSPRLQAEVARRLTPPAPSGSDWETLPYADVAAALLALRRFLYGDRLIAEIRCGQCGSLGDVSISVTGYLAAHQPRPARGWRREGEWWIDGALRFRCPTVQDVLDATARLGAPDRAGRELELRCIDAPAAALRRRAASYLDRLAPALSGEVAGRCPQCQAQVEGWFAPGAFVVAELRSHAGVALEHVHLIAGAYGWPEDAILALPSARRAWYAGQISVDRRM